MASKWIWSRGRLHGTATASISPLASLNCWSSSFGTRGVWFRERCLLGTFGRKANAQRQSTTLSTCMSLACVERLMISLSASWFILCAASDSRSARQKIERFVSKKYPYTADLTLRVAAYGGAGALWSRYLGVLSSKPEGAGR